MELNFSSRAMNIRAYAAAAAADSRTYNKAGQLEGDRNGGGKSVLTNGFGWTRACVKRSAILLTIPRKQEQTKFDDLRRGITEDFQSLAKFKRICQEITDFKRFAF